MNEAELSNDKFILLGLVSFGKKVSLTESSELKEFEHSLIGEFDLYLNIFSLRSSSMRVIKLPGCLH